MGERSGVNLRGEYGPTWEGVNVGMKKVEEVKSEEPKPEPAESVQSKEADQGAEMQVDSKEIKKTTPKPSDKKEGMLFPL